MQLIVYASIFLCAYMVSGRNELSNEESEDEYHLYVAFKLKYNKTYQEDEDEIRYNIFKENMKKAKDYQNKEQSTAKYGVTQFFDLTPEEFKRFYLTSWFPGSLNEAPLVHHKKVGQLPEYFDWRDYGAVGPVLNQGRCGACWAFSAVQNIEGQWFMKTRRFMSLSVQELVDCDYKDLGCGGGYPMYAYEAVQHLGGLELANDYPYVGYRQQCRYNPQQFVAYVNGSVRLTQDTETIADYLCRYGPLSLLINASPLQYYTSGILNLPASYCSPVGLNHAVLSVGLGTEQDTPFWIMKNTWGTSWGEQGYFRIYKGDNTCGINECVTSATVG